jgi:anthranilate synthase component II
VFELFYFCKETNIATVRVLLIDFYDSFTFNITHYLESLGCFVDVIRNDELHPTDLLKYNALVLSPGPGLPSEKKNLMSVIDEYSGKIPILGICLGMQAIGCFLGGELKNQKLVKHGVQDEIFILKDNSVLLKDIVTGSKIGLYHSWEVVDLPSGLISGISKSNVVMAIESVEQKLFGVQFHPESVLTEQGMIIFRNFLNQI